VPLDEFLELQQPDKAQLSHRRSRAMSAMKAYYDALVDLKQGEHLVELAPGNDAGAIQIEGAKPQVEKSLAEAMALKDLAGMDDSDYPWSRYATGSPAETPAPSYRVQLGTAEEAYVARLDEAENAEVYHVDQQAADLELARAEARVLALREVLEEVSAKAPKEPAPNRAARRAAQKRVSSGEGGAPVVPNA
jgi:hypothetical protein